MRERERFEPHESLCERQHSSLMGAKLMIECSIGNFITDGS